MRTRIDWPALVRALMQQGCTQAQIAARMGVSQTAVSNILRGQTEEPSYSRGMALLDMFRAEVSGQPPQIVCERQAA